MRKHARMVVTVVALTAAGWLGTATAQPDALLKSTPAERAKVQTALMSERLSLTPEQLPQVEAINSKYAEQMQPVLTSDEGPLKKRRAAREVESAKDSALQNVLDKDQFRKYVAGKEKLRSDVVQKLAESAGAGKAGDAAGKGEGAATSGDPDKGEKSDGES
ncbi:MAG: hypothetical protein AB1689_20570 [Thermodesulfobacteriota bacterium]